ncbi:hypothetical protein [[Flexibacter] sp. ATCC 35208]|uniref:hypothetical protein n=1 Tax=[Flexibacter] sp. ATCC 35208 TaxID=1936242 RepID=UPI0009CE7705|nr:hypothetical protein [[Flexibacter] sp. ATCC 35208]OMP76590.1 hypothetical protein BW716_24465 [[Flexibacter] sp. ATCC 35208]
MVEHILLTPAFKNKIFENKDVIRLTDISYNESVSLILRGIQKYFFEKGLGVTEVNSELGEEIDINSEYNSVHDGLITVRIRKTGDIYFILEGAFEHFLSRQKSCTAYSVIKLFFISKAYRTPTTIFVPLSDEQLITANPGTSDDVTPIKYVKPINQVGQEYMPDSIKSWLTTASELSITPDVWKISSTKKMITTLGSEFSIVDDNLMLEFKGDRRRTLVLKMDEVDVFLTLCEVIYEIADWIYYQSKDIESRHSLFNYQMSLLLDDDLPEVNSIVLNKKLKVCLENSRLAYRYYLSNASKELNKTLGELNKSMFDYLSKIRQNTADLSSGLWRDFTTVMGVMILNFSIKKADIISKYFPFFAIALCVYVCVSFFITASSGFAFYYNLKSTMITWKSKLYSYLSQTEYDTYCLSPLKTAFNKFRFYFLIVLVAYLALVISVLSVAYS